MALAFHPLANLFPLVEGEEFDELVADVKAHDVREKIAILDGMILDGRNRYRAAIAAGRLEEDDGPDRSRYFVRFVPQVDGDPLEYVISKNLKRRHLNESQRAMVAAKIATMRQGERVDLATTRQNATHTDPVVEDVGGANRKLETTGFVTPKPRPANLPAMSQPNAAKALSISERALRHARRVQHHGVPELIRAVERGHLAVSAADRAARLSAEIQRKIAAEAEAGDPNAARNVIKQETRTVREQELGQKQSALPTKKYGVIVADPEWRFEPWSRETGMDRAADNHYPTSCTEVIAARDVPSIAADDCVLFLWATAPMLPQALLVMAAWGFDYKSHAIWVKDRIGTGYWFRNKHELLLVGTRGSVPAPAMGTQWQSAQGPIAVTEHSAKPDDFLMMIEAYFPTLPKIELNRRGAARPGWDAWGNEAKTEAA